MSASLRHPPYRMHRPFLHQIALIAQHEAADHEAGHGADERPEHGHRERRFRPREERQGLAEALEGGQVIGDERVAQILLSSRLQRGERERAQRHSALGELRWSAFG